MTMKKIVPHGEDQKQLHNRGWNFLTLVQEATKYGSGNPSPLRQARQLLAGIHLPSSVIPAVVGRNLPGCHPAPSIFAQDNPESMVTFKLPTSGWAQ